MTTPEHSESEVGAVRAFVQGALCATAMKELPHLLAMGEVEQEADERGDYLNHFTIVTASGIRIRVTVEAEKGSGTKLDMEYEEARRSLEGDVRGA